MVTEKAATHHAWMIATALLVVAGPVSSATAETKPIYDKRIEEAAIRMLIPKLGDMRGSMALKSNEYLRPLANERVTRSPQAALIPTPVERPRAPENQRVLTSRQGTRDAPTDNAARATPDLQRIENAGPKHADPAASRRSKGSFLFF